MVRFAVRHEYARCVEDVLARRSRLLFLDARLAHTVGARTGDIVREETGRDPGTDAFLALADAYSELPD
jgi:glycerol-3-phosphate dehydrogenase